MVSLLTELRRRNVFKVGAAYAIVGWLLVQVADTLFPRLQLPEWTATFASALVILGFPIALILSWAFELTPEGVKQTRDVPIATSIRHVTGQQLNYIVTGLLVVAIGFLLVDRYVLEGTTTSGPRGVLANSIAVLPFTNLSPNPDDAYFAAGIHEEILNQLAKLRGLNVIARTSVMRYADGTRSIPEIAEELNVATVMEGSVRYADGRVLVTAQLIDPRTNAHLWSESYNRAFSDIFMIQGDIATNIARALETELSLAERESVEQVATGSPAAYALYLRAKASQGIGDAAFARGTWADDLDRAIELDPEFALAYALKAHFYTYILGAPPENWQAIVRENAEKALEVDPTVALAYSALGTLHLLNWQWDEAERAFSAAMALSPSDPDIIRQYAFLKRQLGEYVETLALMQRAAVLSPGEYVSAHQLGISYRHTKSFAAAADAHRTAIELAPDYLNARVGLAQAEAALGDRAGALEQLQIAESLGAGSVPFRLAQMALAYSQIGRAGDAQRLRSDLERMSAGTIDNEAGLALASIAVGDYEQAYAHLERAVEHRSTERVALGELKSNYWSDPVLEEPRFRALRERIGSR